ncbi:MAG: phosphotransferase [Corynebacteriales bacterium]|nr:phosphotransferase [Mycobacteriales bacterium]
MDSESLVVHKAQQLVELASPAFEPANVLYESATTVVFAGQRFGEPIAAKVLVSTAPQWRALFTRELAVYRFFAQHRPPLRVPELLDTDEARGVLFLEHVIGERVGEQRHPALLTERDELARIFTEVRRLGEWNVQVPSPWRVDYAPRLERLRGHNLLDSGEYSAVQSLYARAQRQLAKTGLTFNHGDLELRNIIRTSDGFTYVDWESAGSFLPGFDLAQLWVLLGKIHGPRRVIEDIVTDAGPAHFAPFLVNLVLLLARELRTYQGMKPSPERDETVALLQKDWAQVRTQLLQKTRG